VTDNRIVIATHVTACISHGADGSGGGGGGGGER